MTPAEFSEWELRQEHRHEYHRGEVFPMHRRPDGMAGGTETHARVITNALIALSSALKGRGCFVYSDALAVRIDAEDLFISCSPSTPTGGASPPTPTGG